MGKKRPTPNWPEKDVVENALRRATWRAVMMHKAMGHPVAFGEEGEVRWVAPHEIPEDPDHGGAAR